MASNPKSGLTTPHGVGPVRGGVITLYNMLYALYLTSSRTRVRFLFRTFLLIETLARVAKQHLSPWVPRSWDGSWVGRYDRIHMTRVFRRPIRRKHLPFRRGGSVVSLTVGWAIDRVFTPGSSTGNTFTGSYRRRLAYP